MQALTKLVIKRPVSAIIVVFGLVVFGIMSLLGLPQELTPEMEMPMLIVSTVYPGAGPEDVEKLVSREIEGSVGSLSGIETVMSRSQENMSLVIVSYSYGTNMDIAYTDLKERLDQLRNTLPEDAMDPIVVEMDMNAMATVSLSVSSDSVADLLYYTEEHIVPEFEKLASVADVSVFGGRERYIRVELIEEKMQQYGVAMDTVTGCVSTADFSIPSGTADYGSQSLTVRSAVEYESAEALKNIPIPLGRGNIIRLSDVANVYIATQDAASVSRYNGADNISLGIQKRQSASAVEVSEDVQKIMAELEAEFPDVKITMVQDNSEVIQDSLSTVGSTLVLGVFLSMLVLFLFLGDIKASLIVGSSMPVSLLVTFILLDMMGFTMNIITMSALVLGVGMMVDNSIVVLDSCFKTKNPGKSFKDAALEGTKFVMTSIIASTITTVVVFFPLATIQGMSGQMFRPLGFTIIFSLTASLISAVTLVPLFFTRFKPEERRTAPAARFLKKMERGYSKLLRKLLKKKKTVVAISVALLALSVLIARQLNMELIPAMDEGIVSISVTTRPGLKLERVDEIMTNIENTVREHPDVENYTMSAGGSGISALSGGSSLQVYLREDREMETDEVVELFRQQTATMVDCDIAIESSSSTMSGMSSGTYDVVLKGNDLDDLKIAADQVSGVMMGHSDIISVSTTVEDGSPQAKVVVDAMKAAAQGLTPIQVASNINAAMNGADTVSIRQDDQQYDIRVEYPPEKYVTVGDLRNMVLVSPTGASVPLLDIATIQFSDSPQAITRVDSQYQVTVTGTPTNAARFTAEKDLAPQVEALEFAGGVTLADNTMQEMMNDEFASLGEAIIVAVLLVFMVMAIQFESVKYSLMVMICIPFSLIGSFLLMFLTGSTISMVSLLGFLILVGTVVNNGILFVDTANQYRSSMTVETALVAAGRNRLRSILMTTLTTVLSMMPMAFSIGSAGDMMQGLGVVVIGGLTASTVLTLLLLPSFYLIMDGNPEKRARRQEKKRMKQEAKAAEKPEPQHGVPLAEDGGGEDAPPALPYTPETDLNDTPSPKKKKKQAKPGTDSGDGEPGEVEDKES